MIEAGRVIGDKYRLEVILGELKTGTLWRARHIVLESPVEVKFIRASEAAFALASRLLTEARAAASVRHPNVVGLLDFGTLDDGQPYLVLEHYEGEMLTDRLARVRVLPVREAIDIGAQVLDGLAAIHAVGIVHRDLQPGTIKLVAGTGSVHAKIVDFGVSRIIAPTEKGRRVTVLSKEGIVLGTLPYMSPEQAGGSKDIDRRSDIFSTGVLLYEALTGKRPYSAASLIEFLTEVVKGGPPTSVVRQRPDAGKALSDIVQAAMSIDREDRYLDARAMRAAMLEAAQNLPPPVMTGNSDYPDVQIGPIETMSEEVLLPSIIVDDDLLAPSEPPGPARSSKPMVLERPEERAAAAREPTDRISVDAIRPRPKRRRRRSLGGVVFVIALGAFAAWLAATPRGQSIAGCGRSAIEDALHASASPSALDEEDAGVETEDEVEDAGGALAATTVDGPDAGMGAFAQADYDAGETVQPGDELDAGSAVASADRPDAGRRRRAAGGVVGRGGRGPGGVIRRPDF